MIAAILAVLGVVLLVAGVALLSVPVALVVAGALSLAVALFVDLDRGGES